MPASLAEIEIEGNISALKCPVTGIAVLVEEEGFDDAADHSPHLRFFVDWIGQVWVANPDDLSPDDAIIQSRIIEVFKKSADYETQNDVIEECRQLLPKSALVFEILDPPAGSFEGAICYACFDLGNAARAPRIRLQRVEE